MSELTPPPLQETQRIKENSSLHKFTDVRFGHPLRGFDRDQAVSFFIAQQAGLVDPDANIQFVPFVSDADLNSETTLTIEGFSVNKTIANNHEGSNFNNDQETDAPAAAVLYQAYSRRLNGMKEAKVIDKSTITKVKDLVDWLKAVERGKPVPTPKALRAEDLSDFTQVFYAVKHEVLTDDDVTDKAAETIKRTNAIMQAMFVTTGPTLKETYAEQMAKYEEKREEDFRRLNERIVKKTEEGEVLNEDYVKAIQTKRGLNLTYVDVSGLDVESGGVSVVENAVKRIKGEQTHLVVLIDDEKDDEGEIIGKQIKIKVPKSMANAPEWQDLDLRELAGRLNISERLFGGGVSLIQNADFDGHPQVIGSPAWAGSQMEPKRVFLALEEYFDVPRYDETSIQSKAAEFAAKLGCDTYVVEDLVNPQEEYEIAQRRVLFRIPKDGGHIFVPLREDEFHLYEVAFNKHSLEENQKLFVQKTSNTEPVEITELREVEAKYFLQEYVKVGNAEKILKIIDDLNPNTIQELPGELLLNIFKCISQNPEAIAQVWDKDNLRFHTTRQWLPDWIQPEKDLEKFKAARFQYLFLPTKVDNYMTVALHEYVAESGDRVQQEQFGKNLVDIAISEIYKNAHKSLSYDRLIQSILHFYIDDRIPHDIRQNLLTTLISQYGEDMSEHWKAIQHSDESLTAQIQQQFPEQCASIFKPLDKEVHIERIPGVPRSYIVHPDEEAVYADLERQEQQGKKPIVNILTEIGRPIERLLKAKGILPTENGKVSGQPDRDLSFSSLVKTEGLLDLTPARSEHVQVAYSIIDMVKEVAAIIPAEVKIRIIRTSHPNLLAGDLSGLLVRECLSDPALVNLLDRIVICEYNQQTTDFYDFPLLQDRPKNSG